MEPLDFVQSRSRALLRGTAWLLGTLTLAMSVPAFAATPPQVTLSALARQEGWDPDVADPRPNMDRDIPRDFPVPATSHDLKASNAVPVASVTGTPDEAESFYRVVFSAQGWRVKKQVKFAGHITLIACKASQCVNLSSSSPAVDEKNPNRITMTFFEDKGSG